MLAKAAHVGAIVLVFGPIAYFIYEAFSAIASILEKVS